MSTVSSTLFVAELPADMSESDLSDIFRHLRGYQTSRLRTDKSARVVGFVEFELPEHAHEAKELLDGQRVERVAAPLRMQFAKAKSASASRSPMPGQKRSRDEEHGGGPAAPAQGRADACGHVDGDAFAYEQPPRAAAPPLPPMPPGYPPVALYDPRLSSLAPLVSPLHYAGLPQERLALPLLPADASCTLYVDNVPADATQRELSHIFRPYAGFQSLRLIPKEAKRPAEPRRWLCFAEFDNKFHAAQARNHVQGYRMDKADTRGLGCDFAKAGRAPPPEPQPPRAPDGDGREREGGGAEGSGRRNGDAPAQERARERPREREREWERERPAWRERDEPLQAAGRRRDERGGRRERREDGSERSDDSHAADLKRERRRAQQEPRGWERIGRDEPRRGGGHERRQHSGGGASSSRDASEARDANGGSGGGRGWREAEAGGALEGEGAAASERMDEQAGGAADPHTVPFSLDDDEQM